jgi:[acyl-carrier-protein] S-malonyltransferase
MTKTAWVFPGQGSQALGMGIDLLTLPSAKEKFIQAEAILGWSVIDICQSDIDTLSRTLYTQPSLYVIESIIADILREKGQQPDVVTGHSLGEYIALYVAGVFEWSAGLHLVKRRAELMDSAAGGMMAALMNFDQEELEKVISATPPDAVQAVMSQVKAKRAIPLKVSGAFHSHLMKAAAMEFQEVLDSVIFQSANIPVLSNVDPVPAIEAETLKQRLSQQMTGSVRWREICLQLVEDGIEKVVEIGPGNVLTGLVKRTAPSLILQNIRNAAELPE